MRTRSFWARSSRLCLAAGAGSWAHSSARKNAPILPRRCDAPCATRATTPLPHKLFSDAGIDAARVDHVDIAAHAVAQLLLGNAAIVEAQRVLRIFRKRPIEICDRAGKLPSLHECKSAIAIGIGELRIDAN